MRVLIFGANGFLGRAVANELAKDHKVYKSSTIDSPEYMFADLLDKQSIEKALNESSPEIVINCAGIVENSEKSSLNQTFTENIIHSIIKAKKRPQRIIITGSAAEYGQVESSNIPVSESTVLNATSEYALSKVREVASALELAKQNNLNVVVARVFNPIGTGMKSRFLLTEISRQINEIIDLKRQQIEVNRLDTTRDYIDVRDVALAYRCLVDNEPSENIYNVGSGVQTSNSEVIDLILKHSKLLRRPKIVETQKEKEPLVAVQADISRLKSEFNWCPIYSLEDSIKEIINAPK